MPAPTYDLKPTRMRSQPYLELVRELADQVLARGQKLGHWVERYRDFVSESAREVPRNSSEYVLEALMLGVLWRARGSQVARCVGPRAALLNLLVREHRAGAPRRRDESTALLVSEVEPEPGRADPSLDDIDRLMDWLLATGEYDDEVQRLEGWRQFLHRDAVPSRSALREIIGFAVDFEARSLSLLGVYTAGVHRFLCRDLGRRRPREDTIQCSRQRSEYHFNMVGAEILNRAWRADFLACRRHVVVLPGCSRRRHDTLCRAQRTDTELRCTHCSVGCAASAATRVAARAGAEALTVLHGSDFSHFLHSPSLQGGDVGVVGVACVPGLVGAGWRARSLGLPAQCVLLDASGCEHWLGEAVPTEIDLLELSRIVKRENKPRSAGRQARRAPDSRVGATAPVPLGQCSG